jgi:hypothetical protein
MTKPLSASPPWGGRVLLASLYVFEGTLVLMALSFHKKGDRDLGSWLLTTPGLAFGVAVLLAVAALAVIGREYLRHRAAGARTFGLAVAMNLLAVAFIVIPTEIALRAVAGTTADARTFRDRTLFPRSWEKAAEHNRRIFAKASGDLTYLVYDETLGWTVGSSRRNATGMYLSSAEGLRAASQGAVLAGPKARRRLALVGDSFVFAEQVRFEDSWGHLLESSSGGRLQVLNFGVGGYGVDQAYLRFKKDALAWKPDVAVLAFPLTDLFRSMTVYTFIEWPHWDMPFSKPRIIRENGALRTLNLPTLSPLAIFEKTSIHQLPFLEFDIGYRRHEWEWGVADAALAKRWLFSFLPRYVERNTHTSDQELIEVNRAILLEFARLAKENGVQPIIAYLPGKPEILRLKRGDSTHGQRIMQRIGVPYLDTTPCLMELDPEAAYIVNDPHYSPRGNAAVAKCIARALDP